MSGIMHIVWHKNIGLDENVVNEGETMNENIGLFYFSGTGNTRVVTSLIKKSFQNRSINVEIYPIDDLVNKKAKIEVDKYSMIGIGYPIHGFGEPRIIEAFARLLPQVYNKNAFIFTTAADFISLNYNASAHLSKKLKTKGYNVFYERIICMGSNFFIKYDRELEKQLYLAAMEKAEDLCTDVLAGKKRKIQINIFFAGILSFIHWFEDKLGPIFGRSLQTTKECNLCGLCVRNCPNNNIYVKDNKIKFKKSCFLCLRCVYSCPKKAITSRFFNSFILKNGYDINEIINDKIIPGELTKESTFFRKHFDSYLKDISK